MVKKLELLSKDLPKRVEMAMYQEAQIELTEMKRRTPVDITPNAPHPGNLRNSLTVEIVQKDKTTTAVFATGAQAPYAVYVHENPDALHPVGEYKFMESVLNESRSSMASRLARRIHLNKGR